MERVLVVGESLVDVVRRPGEGPRELPGGSAANAAVALARLGLRVSMVTALGPDGRGRLLHDHLEKEGVGWANDPFSLDRTARAEATIAEDGSAAYDFNVVWRLAEVPAVPPADVMLVSSFAPVLEPGATQVRELVARVGAGVPVVYDVNARPGITGAGAPLLRAVRAMVAQSDVVKASDEDLGVLMPGLDPVTAARRLLWVAEGGQGAAAVVVTLGERGAMWVDRDRVVAAPGAPVAVWDTIGAGDTFGAALVAALIRSGALEGRRPGPCGSRFEVADDRLLELMRWAGRAAAVTVSRPGADPPYLAELPPLRR
ncbi:carbohydrate kinase family protein [Nocardioides houyundeii]|uniref:carbohydrate kinase family protein n=1 Tax=Nocardioides houyundeii TaxID=2045452 RepID=UPI001F534197|nr:PfkB family carbohydrate kinase [Nocardioides houyundeii]